MREWIKDIDDWSDVVEFKEVFFKEFKCSINGELMTTIGIPYYGLKIPSTCNYYEEGYCTKKDDGDVCPNRRGL